MQISLIKTFRNKLKIAVFQSVNSCFCHLVHLYKPLWFDHRLYGCTTTVMGSYTVTVGYYFYQQSQLFQIFHHSFSCFIAIHACIFSTQIVDGCIIVQNVDFFQIMTFSYFKVIRVMCRCDLYTSGSELFVYIRIGDHRNLTVGQRQFQHLSYQIFISVIFRVYRYCGISQKCLRTGRCDLYEFSFFSNYRVVNVPEKSVLILMFYLRVRDRGLAYRTPVDDTGSFVDISFVVQTDKYFLHRFGTSFVHRETLSFPVRRCAQFFQLVNNLSAVLFFPCPGMF